MSVNIASLATIEVVEQIVEAGVAEALNSAEMQSSYKGRFDNLAGLEAKYSVGEINWWAFNIETGTNFVWNEVSQEWTPQKIKLDDFRALRTATPLVAQGACYNVTAN